MKLLAVRTTAPAVALLLLGCTAAYAVSCARPSAPPPRLAKLQVPKPELPKPAPLQPPPGAAPEPTAFRGTVYEARDEGCSTKIVEGLSLQIIEEANCMVGESFAQLPELPNVELDPSVFPFLAVPARDALTAAARQHPSKSLKINSMLRTVAQQYLLYDWYRRGRCGIALAARPGKSNHEGGLAIDISRPARWRSRLREFGFRWLGKRDRWHFDYRSSKAKKHAGLDVEAFQRLWNRNHPDEAIGEDGDYGATTEHRLAASPAAGFAVGAACTVAPEIPPADEE